MGIHVAQKKRNSIMKMKTKQDAIERVGFSILGPAMLWRVLCDQRPLIPLCEWILHTAIKVLLILRQDGLEGFAFWT